ncbi:hypothetical protein ACLOJK_020176 [Asimina triloba]
MGRRRLGNESLVSLGGFGVLYFRALQRFSMEKFKKGVRWVVWHNPLYIFAFAHQCTSLTSALDTWAVLKVLRLVRSVNCQTEAGVKVELHLVEVYCIRYDTYYPDVHRIWLVYAQHANGCDSDDRLVLIIFVVKPDLQQSRGCLGCCTKPTPIIAVDEPTKGLKIQGRTVKKPSLSEDFWSTSTYEMENSGVQSQRSISSISTLYQVHDPHIAGGSSSNPPEFVNHGKFSSLDSNKAAVEWKQEDREPETAGSRTEVEEMVDFLVDVWEQEGMYD